jgi:hypothetical protein
MQSWAKIAIADNVLILQIHQPGSFNLVGEDSIKPEHYKV